MSEERQMLCYMAGNTHTVVELSRKSTHAGTENAEETAINYVQLFSCFQS